VMCVVFIDSMANDSNPSLSKEFVELLSFSRDGDLSSLMSLLDEGLRCGLPISDLLRRDAGRRSFHAACLSGHLSIVQLLIESGSDVSAVWTPLHLASSNGHLSVVKYLIESGSDVSAVDIVDNTPLHLPLSMVISQW